MSARSFAASPACRFDVNDPRFRRVQKLFARRRPEEARRLLRVLVREWYRRPSPDWSYGDPDVAA